MAQDSSNQDQISTFNTELQKQVDAYNAGNSSPDGGGSTITTDQAFQTNPVMVLEAMDKSGLSPAQYSQISGVNLGDVQNAYNGYNPTGSFSTSTALVQGTNYTYSDVNKVPGLFNIATSQSTVNDPEGGSNVDSTAFAQKINAGMANPQNFVQTNLPYLTAIYATDQALGKPVSQAQNDLQGAIGYLSANGVSTSDIQSAVQAGVAKGQDTLKQIQQGQASSGGFLSQMVNSIASPQGIAAIVANSILPGSSAFIPVLSDLASGNTPSISQLANLAIGQSGIGADLNADISGGITDATGIGSDVANSIATGALSTAGSLASGQNLENSLIKGGLSGLSAAGNSSSGGSDTNTTDTTPSTNTATTSPVTTSSSGDPTPLPPLSVDTTPPVDTTSPTDTNPPVDTSVINSPLPTEIDTNTIDPTSSTEPTPPLSLPPEDPSASVASSSDPNNLYSFSSGTGGQGLTAPTDSSTGDGGDLTAPTSPNLTAMGGGQGLTVDTGTGTLSSLGETPTDSQTVMGDPNSFINDPSVTGTAQQTVDSLSNLDSTGNNVVTNTADPNTGEVTTTTTPATLPNNPTSGLPDPTDGSGSTGNGGLSVSNTSSGKSGSGGSGSSSTSNASKSSASSNIYTDPTLSTAPSMLQGAPIYSQSPAQDEQLKQIYSSLTVPAYDEQLKHIYSSLTPELQNVFQQQGIFSNNYGGSGVQGQASGGSIDDQMMVKPINNSPRMLMAAPTQQYLESTLGKPSSRLNQLKAMYASIGARPPSSFSQGMAKGGLPYKYEEAAPEGHRPEFITGLTGYYASGGGTGQSDDIPAMLHQGDYVMDADAVASLGDGSSKAGAENLDKFRKQIPHHKGDLGDPVPAQIADGEYVFPASFVSSLGGGDNKMGAKLLDKMREELREHKRSAPTNKIPPKAKPLTSYLKSAKG